MSLTATATAHAYRAALARLTRGEGRHPKHSGRVVKITPASVAREAGRSRNPLYTIHRNILDEIIAAQDEPAPAKDLAQTISELMSQIRELRATIRRNALEKRSLASENLMLLHRAMVAERHLASESQIGNLAGKPDGIAVVPVGWTGSGGE